jgi:hypothetical protein
MGKVKSKARVALGKKALTKARRVASLAELGVRFVPGTFYSVKNGALHARERRAGKGLGASKEIARVPGFDRGEFYYVQKGVIFARRRK